MESNEESLFDEVAFNSDHKQKIIDVSRGLIYRVQEIYEDSINSVFFVYPMKDTEIRHCFFQQLEFSMKKKRKLLRPIAGIMCCVLRDGKFYRASIKNMTSASSAITELTDYGCSVDTSVNSLYKIPRFFNYFDALGFRIKFICEPSSINGTQHPKEYLIRLLDWKWDAKYWIVEYMGAPCDIFPSNPREIDPYDKNLQDLIDIFNLSCTRADSRFFPKKVQINPSTSSQSAGYLERMQKAREPGVADSPNCNAEPTTVFQSNSRHDDINNRNSDCSTNRTILKDKSRLNSGTDVNKPDRIKVRNNHPGKGKNFFSAKANKETAKSLVDQASFFWNFVQIRPYYIVMNVVVSFHALVPYDICGYVQCICIDDALRAYHESLLPAVLEMLSILLARPSQPCLRKTTFFNEPSVNSPFSGPMTGVIWNRYRENQDQMIFGRVNGEAPRAGYSSFH